MISNPINGGCNPDTGDMVIKFKNEDNSETEIFVPYSQSLLLNEMVIRATNAASNHQKNVIADAKRGEKIETNLRVYDATDVLVALDSATGAPILSIKSTENFQISFRIDKKIFESVGFHRSGIEPLNVAGPYSTVAIDIDYFQKIWGSIFAPPSEIELRWSVAALRRLLIEGYLGRAWRHVGFEREPVIPSPDILDALESLRIEPRHVAVMFAGGGSVNGVTMNVSGLARVYNPSTGQGPDADEGFAVSNVTFARDSRSQIQPSEHDEFLLKKTRLSEFLSRPSLIRRGQIISRQDFIQFYAKWGGGVHLDEARKEINSEIFGLIDEVRGKHDFFGLSGSDFELFSIGHLIANAPDLERLKQALIADSRRQENKQ